MHVLPLRSEKDVEEIRQVVLELGDSCTIVDFEEHIQMQAVRESIRLWRDGDVLVEFGYVDDYNNLCFKTNHSAIPPGLEDEVIAWGIRCLQLRNNVKGTNDPLDHCSSAANTRRRELLLRNGLVQG